MSLASDYVTREEKCIARSGYPIDLPAQKSDLRIPNGVRVGEDILSWVGWHNLWKGLRADSDANSRKGPRAVSDAHDSVVVAGTLNKSSQSSGDASSAAALAVPAEPAEPLGQVVRPQAVAPVSQAPSPPPPPPEWGPDLTRHVGCAEGVADSLERATHSILYNFYRGVICEGNKSREVALADIKESAGTSSASGR